MAPRRIYLQAANLVPDVEVGNPAVDLEKAAAIKGLDDTRIQLATDAMKADDLDEAAKQVKERPEI